MPATENTEAKGSALSVVFDTVREGKDNIKVSNEWKALPPTTRQRASIIRVLRESGDSEETATAKVDALIREMPTRGEIADIISSLFEEQSRARFNKTRGTVDISNLQ